MSTLLNNTIWIKELKLRRTEQSINKHTCTHTHRPHTLSQDAVSTVEEKKCNGENRGAGYYLNSHLGGPFQGDPREARGQPRACRGERVSREEEEQGSR